MAGAVQQHGDARSSKCAINVVVVIMIILMMMMIIQKSFHWLKSLINARTHINTNASTTMMS